MSPVTWIGWCVNDELLIRSHCNESWKYNRAMISVVFSRVLLATVAASIASVAHWLASVVRRSRILAKQFKTPPVDSLLLGELIHCNTQALTRDADAPPFPA